MRSSGSLRHFLGSFACIIAGSDLGRSTYLAVRISAATSKLLDTVIQLQEWTYQNEAVNRSFDPLFEKVIRRAGI